MKCVITGAGFLAQALAKRLVTNGNEVILVNDKEVQVPENTSLVIEDLMQSNTKLTEALQNADLVIATAANVGVDKFTYSTTNGIKNALIDILTISAITDVVQSTKKQPLVLYLSSSEVYGECKNLQETAKFTVNFTNRGSYASEKIFGELSYSSLTQIGCKVRILRPFNIAGSYASDCTSCTHDVISKFVEYAKSGKQIPLYFNGADVRCYMHIQDFVDATLAIISNALANDAEIDIFNIGNPKNKYTSKELAVIIRELTNSESELAYEPCDHQEVIFRKPNIKKLMSLFKPKSDIIRIIKSLL